MSFKFNALTGDFNTSTPVGGTNNLSLNDNTQLRLGSDNDLILYHDNSNAYITNTTGSLHLMAKSGENGVKIIPDNSSNNPGSTELYYDNGKKFFTAAYGCVVQNDLYLNNGNSNVFFDSSGSTFYGACSAVGSCNSNGQHITGSLNGDLIVAAKNTKRIIFGVNTSTNSTAAPVAEMFINSNGQIDGDFNDTSDANLKENINPIPDNAIADIKKLKPVTFDWKETGANNNVSGFIAQDVKEVIPNLINGKEWSEEDPSSRYTINTIGVVAHLTKALQEAIAKIETLETEVVALKTT